VATSGTVRGGAEERPSVTRDGAVAVLFFELLGLLVTGIIGAYHAFGVLLVLTIGTFAALGFGRRGDLLSWTPPLAATVILMAGLVGVYAFENVVVAGAQDTRLGFHPATAFLVYVIWIPGFFTLGLTYTLCFERLFRHASPPRQPAGKAALGAST
jgi:hypothetical protein